MGWRINALKNNRRVLRHLGAVPCPLVVFPCSPQTADPLSPTVTFSSPETAHPLSLRDIPLTGEPHRGTSQGDLTGGHPVRCICHRQRSPPSPDVPQCFLNPAGGGGTPPLQFQVYAVLRKTERYFGRSTSLSMTNNQFDGLS